MICKKIRTALAAGCVFAFSTVMVQADSGDSLAREGSVGCGGNHFLRVGNTELQTSFYDLRNFNDGTALSIDRIRFYDATGALVQDFVAPNLPPFLNNVLGPGNNLLQPHQTAQLSAQDVFGTNFFANDERPLQLIVNWSAERRVVPLEVTLNRVSRAAQLIVNPTGQPTLSVNAERSRSASSCIALRTR